MADGFRVPVRISKDHPPKPPKGCMTLASAAAVLGVEPNSVYKRLRRRDPKAIRYRTVSMQVIAGVDANVIKALVAEDAEPKSAR